MKTKMNILVDDIIQKLDCGEEDKKELEQGYEKLEVDSEEDRRNDEVFFELAKKRVSL
jgi:hypothetical protein